MKELFEEYNKNTKELEKALVNGKNDEIYLVIGFHNGKPAFDLNGNPIVLHSLAESVEEMLDESMKQLDEKDRALLSMDAISDIQKIMKSFLGADDDNATSH